MNKLLFFLSLSFIVGVSLSAQPMNDEPFAENSSSGSVYYAEADTGGNPAAMSTGNAVDPETGTFARISKHQDYGLTITRLVVDLGEGAAVTVKDLSKGLFEVSGTHSSNTVIRTITAMTVTDGKGNAVPSGRYVTVDLDVGFDSDADNAYRYTVKVNRNLGKYSKGTRFIQKGRTLRK